MSRNLLSLGALAAAFCLTLGTADAQARHCRSQHRSQRCCQTNTFGYQQNNCGNQQARDNGCQQTARYAAPAATGCNVQSTGCNAQQVSFTAAPVSDSVPQPPIEQAPAPAPAPAN